MIRTITITMRSDQITNDNVALTLENIAGQMRTGVMSGSDTGIVWESEDRIE